MLFLFDELVLDTDRRELRRKSGSVAVEPQVFDLLEYLVRNRDRVASRDDLLAAVWKGRIVSESTLSSRINAARAAVGDDGVAQRLIRTLPRKGVRFVGEVREVAETALEVVPAKPAGEVLNSLPTPEGPSIAVLPFTNMSGDNESEYFADGMAEEIITALSRCGGIFVIARTSSFTYKGRAIDIRQVGRELGVDYVLEGSVRRQGDRLRITAQLIETQAATHIWADRFDGSVAEVFELQDRIAESTAAILEPKLRVAEVERFRRRPLQSLDAYDLWLKAVAHLHEYSIDGRVAAIDCLNRALQIDPTYAMAMATAAFCHAQRFLHEQVHRPDAARSEGLRLARRAIDLAKEDPNIQWMAGFAIWVFALDTQGARELFRRSLLANPNSSIALTMFGWVEAVNGNPAECRKMIERAQRLNPRHPHDWLMSTGMTIANIADKRFDEAVVWGEKALAQYPHSAVVLRAFIVALVHSGNAERAREIVRQLLAIEPALTISAWRKSIAIGDESLIATYEDGLRKAGLPEA